MVVAARETAMLTAPEIAGWMTTAVAARYLRMSESSIRRLLATGRLAYCPTGLGRLIDPEAVAELAAERATAASAGVDGS